ncbi:hypothetical protein SAMN05421505_10821 [Sinosporangium album]|uniref:Uncharacterized protein n=1 Tax=Sinosporangium album TaxID=504805 RepID=A0A1G7X3F5_9ACTN|nr:hypothetical protein [Sinosporangium album]SDG78715.1 hypothetical protein SAMN05421505_10821 [Sinosporangium album]
MTTVRCPICLHEFPWKRARLVSLDENTGAARELVREDGESDTRWRHRLTFAYRECPGERPPHHLPHEYGEYEGRVVIGMIGTAVAGKTHLLAAMIGEFARTAHLPEVGLRVEEFHPFLHRDYMKTVVEPFLARREQLTRTSHDAIGYVDTLKVTNVDRPRPARYAVTFFDVAGEVQERSGEAVRFLGAVNALIFIVDPMRVGGLGAPEKERAAGDPTFGNALRTLEHTLNPEKRPLLPLPAAFVVNKADLLRHRGFAAVDRWMSRDGEDFHLGTVERESADAYTFLATHGASRWASAASRFADSTLHFASATGVSAEGDYFPERGFQPRRVLKPLLSLLAMKGVVDPGMLGREESC